MGLIGVTILDANGVAKAAASSPSADSITVDTGSLDNLLSGVAAEVQSMIEAIDEFPLNKTIWVPAYNEAGSGATNTTQDRHNIVRQSNSGGNTWMSIPVPDDFSSLVTAEVLVTPDATETINYDISADYGNPGAGEDYNNHSQSAAGETEDVVDGKPEWLDVSGIVTGIAAGDVIGFEFTSNTTYIYVAGIRLVYAPA